MLRLASSRRGVRRVVNGFEYRVDSRCRHRFTPHYEARAAALLRQGIAPGALIYNVGANVGVLTLQLAKWSGPTGTVVAFEPNPYAVRLLRRNIRLNRLDSHVEIVTSAIADAVGELTLHVRGDDPMARAGKPNPLLLKTEAIRVAATTLDEFFDQRQVMPDWVVMDIEGWEIAALQAGRDLLRAGPKRVGIVIELHPDAWSWSGRSRADLERVLSDLKRRAIALSQQKDALAEHGLVYLEPCDCA